MKLQESSMSDAHSTAATEHELAGHLVLVVEDDYFIAEEICAALRQKGASVIGPAADVEHGRMLMAGQPLDCAVLDVNLHGEHVFELAGELRHAGCARSSRPATMSLSCLWRSATRSISRNPLTWRR